MVGLGLAATALAFIFMWRADARLRLAPRRRIGLMVCGVGLLSLGAWPLNGRNADFFNERNFAISSFLTSFADLPQLYSYNGLIEVAPKPSIRPISADAITCKPQGVTPDIVMMLNESSMPPGVYPGLVYPEELTPFFTSFDGRIHPLRVETFGGGTWLSDFSALTGLSTHSFGNLRNFVANFMTGRLRHSLPQYLRACGYETAIIYPASAGFAGVGRFYEAIGFDRVIDTSVHKAVDQRQRDAFYLGEAAKFLEAQTQGPRKPRFVVLSSMSTHSPFTSRTHCCSFGRSTSTSTSSRPVKKFPFTYFTPASTFPFFFGW
jgi:phosphoglycerol transferase MdoB-like AlkP superfamily enzyme